VYFEKLEGKLTRLVEVVLCLFVCLVTQSCVDPTLYLACECVLLEPTAFLLLVGWLPVDTRIFGDSRANGMERMTYLRLVRTMSLDATRRATYSITLLNVRCDWL
jgi:hypothetical protein